MNGAPAIPPAQDSSLLVRFCDRVTRSIYEHERFYLLFSMTVFIVADAYKAVTAPLWFDEFFTLFFSRLSPVLEMLKAIPVDSQPPLQYLLTHLSLLWLGESEFAVRLPELLAYVAVGLLTYKIVRFHGTAIQSLFAVAMVMGGFVARQAYTARPYGLLLAFTALTFACWQMAVLRQKDRLLPLFGVSFGIAGAILSHNFGIVHIGLFLAAGEIVRIFRRRRLDGRMLVAIVAGFLALTITVPLAHESRIPVDAVLHSTNLYYRPSFAKLFTYVLMVPVSLLCLVAGLAFLPWPKRMTFSSLNAIPEVPPHEWAAITALSLIVPLQLLITAVTVGQYATRYAIGTSLGLALLGGFALPRVGRLRMKGQVVLALSTLCYLFIISINLMMALVREPVWRAQPGLRAVSPLLLDARGDAPIVVASALDYASEWWYSPAAIRGRLIYLNDFPYAESQPVVFLPEFSLVLDKTYTPFPTIAYAAFIEAHPHFLLLSAGDPNFVWILSRLTDTGWHLSPIAKSGTDVLYQVDMP